MAIEGTLDLFQLPEILQLIAHQGKTGILTVQGEKDIVAISFENGKVVAADALNQTLEDAMGEVLAGQGLVSPGDFADVASDHQAGKGRLMDLLVERDLVGRGELLAALQLHTYRLLIDLLGWNKGEFKFYTGDEVSYEEGFPPISIDELLIRSVEEAAGEGHPTIPDSRSLYNPVRNPPGVIRVREEGQSPTDEEGLWITSAEKELLDRLLGGRTLAEAVRMSGGEEYKVRYALHRLLELGLVERQNLIPDDAFAGTVSMPTQPAQAPAAAREELSSWDEAALGGELPSASSGGDMVDNLFAHRDSSSHLGIDVPPDAGARQEAPRAEPAKTALPPTVASSDEETDAPSEVMTSWSGRALALLPLAILFVVFVRFPLHLFLPFPWQEEPRQVAEAEMRAVSYQTIDRAAKTYYLLESRFPDQLRQLVELGLLDESDLRDPQGRSFAWSPAEETYRLDDADGVVETISGNFLLDPAFLVHGADAEAVPLVLLD